MQSLGEKINWLFANIKKPDGTEYSLQDVENGTQELGERVTTSNLHKLRHNQIRNPGFLTLHSIAVFFGVPLSFFHEKLTEEQLEQLKPRQLPSKMQELVLRASNVDEAGQDQLIDMAIFLATRLQQRRK